MTPMEPLTLESLARAIHETSWDASHKFGDPEGDWCGEDGDVFVPWPRDYERLEALALNIRREQARLMMERIMR